ncbi:hypothetical protein TBLA_0F02840 [Henningerozyma blattae CBS 6284]|uniref:TLC domain-containing protein n=1 Tax=Henningerozyma blattae (strain ATCC 34711 / CBS 6284 / DSM 70876 / NBRC 10599 / NRRL Y-10934 / UCD 77-7) TaxID=1071380 RepID=I2H621_HENB6|nr:hypothetical protein TBLA_0F02840 [Tetrapisispora blattae CBS 6284]CCH61823.1 hypothetical protein TBLA_0F02840 [Tetrapisispora blattae CBS 6284]
MNFLVKNKTGSACFENTNKYLENARYSDPFLKYSWFPNSTNLFYLHLHEIITTFSVYQFISTIVAPITCSVIFGKYYNGLYHKTIQLNFDLHMVSMFQCLISFTCIIITWGIPVTDINPIAYTDQISSLVGALTMGYFLWDIVQGMTHIHTYEIEYILYAMGAFALTLITFNPFVQPWISTFLAYETSTPFTNINWFIIALTKNYPNHNLIPNWINYLNATLLVTVFVLTRLVWGPYQQFLLLQQLYQHKRDLPAFKTTLLIVIMTMMNGLNVYWFSKMVRIVRKLSRKQLLFKLKKP